MKEVEMDIEWRTVQFFLEETGIAEVEIDYENSRKVRCSCNSFQLDAKCKHQKWVKRRMVENGGNFALLIPEDIDEDEAEEALGTAEGFREFVIKYGEIEVI